MEEYPIYYVNYIDPETGFLRYEEFSRHRDMTTRAEELRRKGVKHITTGHSGRPTRRV